MPGKKRNAPKSKSVQPEPYMGSYHADRIEEFEHASFLIDILERDEERERLAAENKKAEDSPPPT